MSLDLLTSVAALVFKSYVFVHDKLQDANNGLSTLGRRLERLFPAIKDLQHLYTHGALSTKIAAIHFKQELINVLLVCCELVWHIQHIVALICQLKNRALFINFLLFVVVVVVVVVY